MNRDNSPFSVMTSPLIAHILYRLNSTSAYPSLVIYITHCCSLAFSQLLKRRDDLVTGMCHFPRRSMNLDIIFI